MSFSSVWLRIESALRFDSVKKNAGRSYSKFGEKRSLRLENLEARHLLSVSPWEVGQDALVGFYSFENGTDSEFGSFHGTGCGDAFTQYSETLNSSVLVLDGQGDYVNLGNPDAMNFTGQITLSAWVKADAANGTRNIIAHGHATNPNGEVFLRIKDGYYEIGSWNGSDSKVRAAIPAGDAGAWVHLAGTYDGSAWRLYRNGVEIATASSNIGSVQVNANWSIGANGAGTERFFQGMLDNVAIHNWALTPLQVQELAQRANRGAIGTYDCTANEDGILYDSENNLNGTLENGAAFAYDLDFGDYLSFNGNGAYVNLGNSDMMNFSGEITLAAWVKPTSTGGTQNIIAHGFTTNPKAEVSLRIANGKYEIGVYNGTNYYAGASIPAEDIGNWVHLSGTYDGTTWRLYRNGVEIASLATIIGAIPVSANWAIGSTGDGTQRFFRGGVDEVVIYDKALSQQELEQLAAPREIFMPTPVEAWSCAPSDAGILYGVEGNVNGTLENGVQFTTDEMFGGALDFSNNNGYVTLGDDASMQITGEITLSAWIKPNSSSGTQNIITKGFARNPDGEILLRIANGQYQVGVWNGSNHYAAFTIPAEDVGTWVHLLGTYDGTAWRLYRNGELVATKVDSVGAIAVNAGWVIGASTAAATGGNDSRYFDGQITALQVFDTAVSANQAVAFSKPENAPKPEEVELLSVRVGGEAYAFCNTGNLTGGNSEPYTLYLDANGQDDISWEINWGDGSKPELVSPGATSVTHAYDEAGEKTIVVTAKCKGTDVPMTNTTIAIAVYETGELIVNGDFESTRIPDNRPWWIFNGGDEAYRLEGWSGRIEIQAGQYAELDSDAHQQNENHPSLEACGDRTKITSDGVTLIPGMPYIINFDTWNRSAYAEDNMVKVTVPGTITHINGIPISQYGSNLTSAIMAQVVSNSNNQFALTRLEGGSSVIYSAGGNIYRYKDAYGELQETGGVSPFHISSITFIPTATSGSVSFADASTDDVVPSYGPFLDDVSIAARCVVVDIDVDSNNDGEMDEFDDPIEEDSPGCILGVNGKMALANIQLQQYGAALSQSGGKLKLVVPEGISIWENENGTSSGAFLASYDAATRTFEWDVNTGYPASIYVEATKTPPLDYTLELEFYSSTNVKICSDKVQFASIFVDLNIDSNNDGKIDDLDKGADPDSLNEPGKIIAVGYGQCTEMELVAEFSAGITDKDFFTFSLDYDDSLIKIYTTNLEGGLPEAKRGEALDLSDYLIEPNAPLPEEIATALKAGKATLYIDGFVIGSTTITLNARKAENNSDASASAGSMLYCSDTVKVTVGLDIDVDSNNKNGIENNPNFDDNCTVEDMIEALEDESGKLIQQGDKTDIEITFSAASIPEGCEVVLVVDNGLSLEGIGQANNISAIAGKNNEFKLNGSVDKYTVSVKATGLREQSIRLQLRLKSGGDVLAEDSINFFVEGIEVIGSVFYGIEDESLGSYITVGGFEVVTYDTASLSDFTAEIFWGDGQKSGGTIRAAEETDKYYIEADHTYQQEGAFTSVIYVQYNAGSYLKGFGNSAAIVMSVNEDQNLEYVLSKSIGQENTSDWTELRGICEIDFEYSTFTTTGYSLSGGSSDSEKTFLFNKTIADFYGQGANGERTKYEETGMLSTVTLNASGSFTKNENASDSDPSPGSYASDSGNSDYPAGGGERDFRVDSYDLYIRGNSAVAIREQYADTELRYVALAELDTSWEHTKTASFNTDGSGAYDWNYRKNGTITDFGTVRQSLPTSLDDAVSNENMNLAGSHRMLQQEEPFNNDGDFRFIDTSDFMGIFYWDTRSGSSIGTTTDKIIENGTFPAAGSSTSSGSNGSSEGTFNRRWEWEENIEFIEYGKDYEYDYSEDGMAITVVRTGLLYEYGDYISGEFTISSLVLDVETTKDVIFSEDYCSDVKLSEETGEIEHKETSARIVRSIKNTDNYTITRIEGNDRSGVYELYGSATLGYAGSDISDNISGTGARTQSISSLTLSGNENAGSYEIGKTYTDTREATTVLRSGSIEIEKTYRAEYTNGDFDQEGNFKNNISSDYNYEITDTSRLVVVKTEEITDSTGLLTSGEDYRFENQAYYSERIKGNNRSGLSDTNADLDIRERTISSTRGFKKNSLLDLSQTLQDSILNAASTYDGYVYENPSISISLPAINIPLVSAWIPYTPIFISAGISFSGYANIGAGTVRGGDNTILAGLGDTSVDTVEGAPAESGTGNGSVQGVTASIGVNASVWGMASIPGLAYLSVDLLIGVDFLYEILNPYASDPLSSVLAEGTSQVSGALSSVISDPHGNVSQANGNCSDASYNRLQGPLFDKIAKLNFNVITGGKLDDGLADNFDAPDAVGPRYTVPEVKTTDLTARLEVGLSWGVFGGYVGGRWAIKLLETQEINRTYSYDPDGDSNIDKELKIQETRTMASPCVVTTAQGGAVGVKASYNSVTSTVEIERSEEESIKSGGEEIYTRVLTETGTETTAVIQTSIVAGYVKAGQAGYAKTTTTLTLNGTENETWADHESYTRTTARTTEMTSENTNANIMGGVARNTSDTTTTITSVSTLTNEIDSDHKQVVRTASHQVDTSKTVETGNIITGIFTVTGKLEFLYNSVEVALLETKDKDEDTVRQITQTITSENYSTEYAQGSVRDKLKSTYTLERTGDGTLTEQTNQLLLQTGSFYAESHATKAMVTADTLNFNGITNAFNQTASEAKSSSSQTFRYDTLTVLETGANVINIHKSKETKSGTITAASETYSNESDYSRNLNLYGSGNTKSVTTYSSTGYGFQGSGTSILGNNRVDVKTEEKLTLSGTERYMPTDGQSVSTTIQSETTETNSRYIHAGDDIRGDFQSYYSVETKTDTKSKETNQTLTTERETHSTYKDTQKRSGNELTGNYKLRQTTTITDGSPSASSEKQTNQGRVTEITSYSTTSITATENGDSFTGVCDRSEEHTISSTTTTRDTLPGNDVRSLSSLTTQTTISISTASSSSGSSQAGSEDNGEDETGATEQGNTSEDGSTETETSSSGNANFIFGEFNYSGEKNYTSYLTQTDTAATRTISTTENITREADYTDSQNAVTGEYERREDYQSLTTTLSQTTTNGPLTITATETGEMTESTESSDTDEDGKSHRKELGNHIKGNFSESVKEYLTKESTITEANSPYSSTTVRDEETVYESTYEGHQYTGVYSSSVKTTSDYNSTQTETNQGRTTVTTIATGEPSSGSTSDPDAAGGQYSSTITDSGNMLSGSFESEEKISDKFHATVYETIGSFASNVERDADQSSQDERYGNKITGSFTSTADGKDTTMETGKDTNQTFTRSYDGESTSSQPDLFRKNTVAYEYSQTGNSVLGSYNTSSHTVTTKNEFNYVDTYTDGQTTRTTENENLTLVTETFSESGNYLRGNYSKSGISGSENTTSKQVTTMEVGGAVYEATTDSLATTSWSGGTDSGNNISGVYTISNTASGTSSTTHQETYTSADSNTLDVESFSTNNFSTTTSDSGNYVAGDFTTTVTTNSSGSSQQTTTHFNQVETIDTTLSNQVNTRTDSGNRVSGSYTSVTSNAHDFTKQATTVNEGNENVVLTQSRTETGDYAFTQTTAGNSITETFSSDITSETTNLEADFTETHAEKSVMGTETLYTLHAESGSGDHISGAFNYSITLDRNDRTTHSETTIGDLTTTEDTTTTLNQSGSRTGNEISGESQTTLSGDGTVSSHVQQLYSPQTGNASSSQNQEVATRFTQEISRDENTLFGGQTASTDVDYSQYTIETETEVTDGTITATSSETMTQTGRADSTQETINRYTGELTRTITSSYTYTISGESENQTLETAVEGSGDYESSEEYAESNTLDDIYNVTSSISKTSQKTETATNTPSGGQAATTTTTTDIVFEQQTEGTKQENRGELDLQTQTTETREIALTENNQNITVNMEQSIEMTESSQETGNKLDNQYTTTSDKSTSTTSESTTENQTLTVEREEETTITENSTVTGKYVDQSFEKESTVVTTTQSTENRENSVEPTWQQIVAMDSTVTSQIEETSGSVGGEYTSTSEITAQHSVTETQTNQTWNFSASSTISETITTEESGDRRLGSYEKEENSVVSETGSETEDNQTLTISRSVTETAETDTTDTGNVTFGLYDTQTYGSSSRNVISSISNQGVTASVTQTDSQPNIESTKIGNTITGEYEHTETITQATRQYDEQINTVGLLITNTTKSDSWSKTETETGNTISGEYELSRDEQETYNHTLTDINQFVLTITTSDSGTKTTTYTESGNNNSGDYQLEETVSGSGQHRRTLTDGFLNTATNSQVSLSQTRTADGNSISGDLTDILLASTQTSQGTISESNQNIYVSGSFNQTETIRQTGSENALTGINSSMTTTTISRNQTDTDTLTTGEVSQTVNRTTITNSTAVANRSGNSIVGDMSVSTNTTETGSISETLNKTVTLPAASWRSETATQEIATYSSSFSSTSQSQLSGNEIVGNYTSTSVTTASETIANNANRTSSADDLVLMIDIDQQITSRITESKSGNMVSGVVSVTVGSLVDTMHTQTDTWYDLNLSVNRSETTLDQTIGVVSSITRSGNELAGLYSSVTGSETTTTDSHELEVGTTNTIDEYSVLTKTIRHGAENAALGTYTESATLSLTSELNQTYQTGVLQIEKTVVTESTTWHSTVGNSISGATTVTSVIDSTSQLSQCETAPDRVLLIESTTITEGTRIDSANSITGNYTSQTGINTPMLTETQYRETLYTGALQSLTDIFGETVYLATQTVASENLSLEEHSFANTGNNHSGLYTNQSSIETTGTSRQTWSLSGQSVNIESTLTSTGSTIAQGDLYSGLYHSVSESEQTAVLHQVDTNQSQTVTTTGTTVTESTAEETGNLRTEESLRQTVTVTDSEAAEVLLNGTRTVTSTIVANSTSNETYALDAYTGDYETDTTITSTQEIQQVETNQTLTATSQQVTMTVSAASKDGNIDTGDYIEAVVSTVIVDSEQTTTNGGRTIVVVTEQTAETDSVTSGNEFTGAYDTASTVETESGSLSTDTLGSLTITIGSQRDSLQEVNGAGNNTNGVYLSVATETASFTTTQTETDLSAGRSLTSILTGTETVETGEIGNRFTGEYSMIVEGTQATTNAESGTLGTDTYTLSQTSDVSYRIDESGNRVTTLSMRSEDWTTQTVSDKIVTDANQATTQLQTVQDIEQTVVLLSNTITGEYARITNSTTTTNNAAAVLTMAEAGNAISGVYELTNYSLTQNGVTTTQTATGNTITDTISVTANNVTTTTTFGEFGGKLSQDAASLDRPSEKTALAGYGVLGVGSHAVQSIASVRYQHLSDSSITTYHRAAPGHILSGASAFDAILDSGQQQSDRFCFVADTLVVTGVQQANPAPVRLEGTNIMLAALSVGLMTASVVAKKKRRKEETMNRQSCLDSVFADYEPEEEISLPPVMVQEKRAEAPIVEETASEETTVVLPKIVELPSQPEKNSHFRSLLATLFFALALLCGYFALPSANTQAVPQVEPQYLTKAIQDIEVGDEVLAYNVLTQRAEKCKVTATSHLTSDHVRYLTVRGGPGGEQTLQTTDRHPFWVVTDSPDVSRLAASTVMVHDVASDSDVVFFHENRHITDEGFYVEAADLQPGDVFLSPTGELATLVETHREDHPDGIDVYNFTVADNSNYFVIANYEAYLDGAQPVLVHNAKCGETSATIRGKRAHKNYRLALGEGYKYEHTIQPKRKGAKAIRVDAIDLENKIVRELKPHNARQIRQGTKQLENYKRVLTDELGGEWTTHLDTYNPD